MKKMGIKKGNTVTTPGTKEDDIGVEETLTRQEETQCRAMAARAMYLSQDRSDIQYSAKELARKISTPTWKGFRDLKRQARYLVGHTRAVLNMPYQDEYSSIDIWTDTDFAGCKETRKSTCGGVAKVGSRVIKTWSSTMSIVSLSSGEAEL